MRRRPPDRVEQIVGASLRVFGEKGFRRTQMADVARAMGVSPGTLYNYVTGKEALFYLMIDRACLDEPATDTPKFPLPAPSPGAIIQRLRERLRADVRLPTLEAALARGGGGGVRLELTRIVGELYTRIDRRRLRPVPHVQGASRLILEAVADFAMHRHLDPDPVRIDDGAAREAVVDFVVHALLPPGSRTTRQHKEQ